MISSARASFSRLHQNLDEYGAFVPNAFNHLRESRLTASLRAHVANCACCCPLIWLRFLDKTVCGRFAVRSVFLELAETEISSRISGIVSKYRRERLANQMPIVQVQWFKNLRRKGSDCEPLKQV
jgi:hypothetical protein